MAGIDPISLAVIGAATGAIASPRDPLKGALLGGAAGFTGGSALAASGSAAAAGGIGASQYAAAVPGLTAAGPGSQAAMLAAQTGEFGLGGLASTAAAGSAPGTLGASFWNMANKATMPGTSQNMQLARTGMNLLSPQQQQAPTPTPSMYRGAKQVTTTEPIASLFDVNERKRKPVMSLL